MNRLSALPRAGCALVFLAALGFSATKEVDLRRDVNAAATVVTGVVDRVYSYYSEDGDIYSDITLRVTSVLKQENETPDTITFTIPGGEVGDEGVLYTSSPEFALNEPVLVFLEATEEGKVLASAKYAMDGSFLSDVNLQPLDLLRRIQGQLEESGRPVRETEWRRATAFLEHSKAAPRKSAAGGGVMVLNAGSAACYKLMGPKWRINNVTYKLDSSLPAGFATAIAAGVAPFNAAGIPLRLSMNPFSANVVSYGPISGSGILAQTRVSYQPATSTIMGFTLVFNRNFTWSLTGEAGKFDVQGIGAHEFGHAVGLNHPDDSSCDDQTMWFSAGPGETNKRTLEVGDLAGLTAMYGAAPPPSAPPPSTPAPTPAPAVPAGQAPPVPVFSSLSTSGTLSSNNPITLNVTGSNFITNTVGLQYVIKGSGCPSTGCIIDTRVLQNLTTTTARAIFTPSGGGSFSVRLRNTATGVQSSNAFSFTVGIAMRR